jgi:GNAT superfamily N-acetyltransferase
MLDMNGISIRHATINDIATLLRHRRMMWWDMGRRDGTALEWMEQAARDYFSTAVADGSYQGFLAMNENKDVLAGAGIVISPWPGQFHQKHARRAMILNMYVEREYRRKGIARALMEAIIAWCREQQFSRVGLHASDEGRPLYERLGFKPTNEMSLDLL